jgi:glycosyltransferase involved in cell wall biosynthesis
MIVSFVWPSSHHRTGGVVAQYEFANALARRGHQVNFFHSPRWPGRIESMDELDWFSFHPGVMHYIADDDSDPRLQSGDVFFKAPGPARLGLPCSFIQGARMFDEEVERETFRRPLPKVCIARWLVDLGRRYGVPAEQLWHVPMGIDHGVFRDHTPDHQRIYDVAVCYNDHPTKDWPLAVAALRLAHERRPDLRTVVFGPATPPEDLPGEVEFRERPDHVELADEVYNRSRVFVQSSFREGFGFTAVEAMACGAALVTTDNGGSDDYADPDRTAWVVPPSDAVGLAEGIVTLLEQTDRRVALADRGKDLVRRFDWDRGAQLLEAHLEQYLADPDRFRAEPVEGERSVWA